ncbi:Zn(2)-C6 fungal-type domain-containing protein [Fusarium falciforme]|uniref:Zn(2)-C6 fungal-type domain-containing protein n=1 Tax=Fusarium falciforme TaxID=195108 RepID=UPI0023005477|nr:Zn(2)-C6 fungal-type domain-containing protein [Fusarium falciforme]WAO88936.1 Zn(2)-C6 fungal-type domain-containing protein [Fusarium falciforme]
MTLSNTPESTDQAGSKARKLHVACLRCRERKVRCSGLHPCANCQRRSTECVFEPEDRKVIVSENYLNELKRKAGEENDPAQCAKRHQPTPKPSKDSSPVNTARNDAHSHDEVGVDPHIDSFSALSNPLVTTPPQFVTDIRGRKRFLGPSSTWAYSRHIMSMIRHNLDQKGSNEVPLNVDGAAYALEFPNMRNLGSISMEDLPSLDYALYLTNTVKFHAGQTYHLFHEQTFMQGLFSLYSHGPDSLNLENRVWFVHFFVIMALGKALLARDLLPDVNGLYRDPITAVELGLGLRIALTQGYHRDFGGSPGCYKDASRYRGVWWTLYILDRKFSTLIGAPSSIHDSDISVPFPKPHQSAQKTCALDMHVRLSRLLAKVLNTVYCVDEHLNSSFLRNIQATVRELADLATEMNATPELKLSKTDPISRVSATCIVLAIRPLLVCLLRDKLDRRTRQDRQDTAIIEPVKALLRTAYESAQKSLRVLTRLQAQDLLEYFLPFDLDHVFSAGFVLSLIVAVHPASADGYERYLETPYALLDTLIAGGNVPACFKRQELNCLRDMLRCLMEPHSCPNPQDVNETGFLSGTTGDLSQHGVSPNEMMALASLLEGDSMVQIDPEVVDSWLWESVGAESVPAMDQPAGEC